MLSVENLSLHFEDRGEIKVVVQGISFRLDESEILGIVGESGSGKTMTALTIAGLTKEHEYLDSGNIYFEGTDLLTLSPKEMREIQGRDISMIFQESMTALNPTMKIGRQVEEALVLHTGLSREARRIQALKAMADVELENTEVLYEKYPHELSGGMRQRVMIAAAIVCRPKLLIADEPTTALDVATQDSILKLLKKLNLKYHMGILFISHNLRVINELCSRVLVMKDGKILEEGTVEEIFEMPLTQYTKALIEAIPGRVKNGGFHQFLKLKAGE
jgi:peptide/nickel transport system ATP-binding protein